MKERYAKIIDLILVIIIACSVIFCCTTTNEQKLLPGKMVVRKQGFDSTEIIVSADGKNISTFKFNAKGEIQYGGCTWLNTEDTFIGDECIPGKDHMEYRCSIVKFDLHGKVIDRIYEAEKGELAWPAYSSKEDQYFLFTTHRILDYRQYPFEGLTPMLSLHIMDMKTKKIIKTIDSIGRSPNFRLNESPWLIDGRQFVYSISEVAKLMMEGEPVNPETRKLGIYLYNLKTGEEKMIVPDAFNVIASPVANQIAYEKKESICVLDLENNSEKIIYKKGAHENIRDIHWTPDGQSIYLAYVNQYDIELFNNSGEELIDIKSGEEVPFKGVNQGFQNYSWK